MANSCSDYHALFAFDKAHRFMPDNRLRLPSQSPLAKGLNACSNSTALAQWRRWLLSKLPFTTLQSDVVDVVYASWVVPVAAVQALVPKHVQVVNNHGQTILTVLSYRHGHFGPAFLGPLRRWLPSPLQSNWRLYVSRMPNGAPADKVVLFIKNIFSSSLYGVGSRLLSDALPSHVAQRFVHQKSGSSYHTAIDAGTGSAPSFTLSVDTEAAKRMPAAFQAFFPNWDHAVHYLTLQDSALSAIADSEQLAHAGIDLPIDPQTVRAAQVRQAQVGAFLAAHGVAGEPLCFVVPQVRFRVLWEKCI